MRRRLLRKPLIIGVVVVIIAAGVGTFFLTRGDAASASYRTGVATLGTITQTVSLSGNLAPNGETDLDFDGSGKVTSVNVEPGQTVAAGQVQKLAKHGVDTFHFYTMNRADLVFAISHLLGLRPNGAQKAA